METGKDIVGPLSANLPASLLTFFWNNTIPGEEEVLLDDKTVYISYGASPQYDVSREMYFDDLTVTFDPRRKEEAYEKDSWFNIERTSKRPLAWQKENLGIFPQRRCRKWERNQSIEFDLFHYTLLVLDRSYELEYQGILAQWADFDNVGRLVCGHGNLIIVYDNLKQAISQTPKSVINLDNFID